MRRISNVLEKMSKYDVVFCLPVAFSGAERDEPCFGEKRGESVMG